jgi:hypothetical protein
VQSITSVVAVGNHSLEDLAIHVASKFPVFACDAEKRPLTRHGFHDATRDEAIIRTMFADPRAALIGVPTGWKTDLLVIDVDPKGMPWFEANRERLFPATRTHHTPRGLHLLYAMPTADIRCATDKPVEGCDIRANGGYICWHPASGYPVENATLHTVLPS